MSMQYVKHRIAIERRIVGMIIQDALAQNYEIEVFTGDDENPLVSTSFVELLNEAMSADECSFAFFKPDGWCGSVYFVFGNDGFDVIADHTDNKETRAIIRRAEAYAETAEAEEVLI